MALRINSFDDRNVTQLNKWAKEVENTTNAHKKQINDFNILLQKVFEKNPDLIKP